MEKNGRTWELYPSFLHIFSNTASLADWKEIWTSTATEVTRGKLDSHQLVCTPSHTVPVFQSLNKACHYLSRNDSTLRLCIFNHALANPALWVGLQGSVFTTRSNACEFEMEGMQNRPIFQDCIQCMCI